jgi:hypothetical protein
MPGTLVLQDPPCPFSLKTTRLYNSSADEDHDEDNEKDEESVTKTPGRDIETPQTKPSITQEALRKYNRNINPIIIIHDFFCISPFLQKLTFISIYSRISITC